jgi:hypothetical protein
MSQPNFRRRLAPLVLVLGGLGLWSITQDHLPHEQPVQVLLPPIAREKIRVIRLTYTLSGEAVTGTEQRFQGPAPTEVRHAPSLANGQYGLTVALVDEDGGAHLSEHTLTIPSRGTTRIRLGEPTP